MTSPSIPLPVGAGDVCGGLVFILPPTMGRGYSLCAHKKKRPRMGRFSKPRQDSDYTEASSISCFAAFRSFIFLNHLSMMIMNGQEM